MKSLKIKKIQLWLAILYSLILFSFIGYTSFGQTQLTRQSTLMLGNVNEGIDYLIELYNLRRAYAALESNYRDYRYQAKMILESAVNEVIVSKDEEISFWKQAFEQENKWYDTFWFGASITTAILILIVYMVQ